MESGPRPGTRAVDPGSIVFDAGEHRTVADAAARPSEGSTVDGTRTTPALRRLDPVDTSVWESTWMPASGVSGPTANTTMRFELELRAWGRLEVGCAPVHPRGWHVSIASESAIVRRRLRGESSRLGDALCRWAGHDDVTLEVSA